METRVLAPRATWVWQVELDCRHGELSLLRRVRFGADESVGQLRAESVADTDDEQVHHRDRGH